MRSHVALLVEEKMADLPGPVTVIIPAYRAGDFIAPAVQSALGQTICPKVIVVDDASGDDTAQRAQDAGGTSERLSVLVQDTNQGPAAARNRAIDAATTDWIALLDADDRMAPDRLESLVRRGEARSWDFVADDLIRIMPGQSPEAGRRHWSDEDFGEIELDFARFVLENLYAVTGHGRELGYLKPLMRRRFLNEHGLRYRPSMRLGEDFDLYARALLAGASFGLTDPAGYHAIDRPGSLSKQHRAADLQEVWRADRSLMRSWRLKGDDRAALKAHMQLAHKKWAWVRLIEAVRARNPVEAAASFLAPPAVIADLVERIYEHFAQGDGRDIGERAHGS